MIEQIYYRPCIYRIFVPLPENPLKYLNSYVIESSGDYLIIDTGFNRPECREALFKGIQELNVDLKHTRLFLTHLHGDHIGLAEYFIDKTAGIYMNPVDYAYFRGDIEDNTWGKMESVFRSEGFPEEEIKKQISGNQARLYSPRVLFPFMPVRDNDIIQMGDLTFRCIHTPGHTPGHTCLYLENEKIIFSGDHVLFDITPNISIWWNVPSSLADYLQSLQKIKMLDVNYTFPGHREFKGSLRQRIDSLTEHHYERLNEILYAVALYPGCTAYEAAGRISWSSKGRLWEEFSPNQKWFAMGETMAHLKWLQDRQYVVKTEQRGYRALRKRISRKEWR